VLSLSTKGSQPKKKGNENCKEYAEKGGGKGEKEFTQKGGVETAFHLAQIFRPVSEKGCISAKKRFQRKKGIRRAPEKRLFA